MLYVSAQLFVEHDVKNMNLNDVSTAGTITY